MLPLNWKQRLPRGHREVLMSMDPQPKKELVYRLELVILIVQEKWGCCYTMGAQRTMSGTQGFSECLLGGPCKN